MLIGPKWNWKKDIRLHRKETDDFADLHDDFA